jgi:hypothetical protein
VAEDDLVMEGRRRWCSMPMGRVLGSRGEVEIGARQRERTGSSRDLFIGDWGNERGVEWVTGGVMTFIAFRVL